ncbi:MAG: Cache 3/Cache 2 fusion domain-containing protein [Bacteroidota bacterium]
MPHLLKNRMMQMLQGLDESVHQYKQAVDEMVKVGYLTPAEGQERLLRYQSSLTDICQLVDGRPGQLGIDQHQRQELKKEFQRIEWRLQMHGTEQSAKNETDAIVAYLNHKRQQAMGQLEHSMQIARSLFQTQGEITESNDSFIQMKAVEQVNRDTQHLRLPCWYWGQTPVHYDQQLVDEIERQTNCQATIFQRIPEGFIRISTNIRNLKGRRGVGTFIPLDSKVISTVLKGETYRGSAFVLNNWYLSIYEPFYLNGKVEGILYVGREEALELMPTQAWSAEKVEKIFAELRANGAFETGMEDGMTEKLVKVLSDLPDHGTHPVIKIGLKEVAAMLMKEREKRQTSATGRSPGPNLEQITKYIQENLAEDISIDFLAQQSFMSKASFYRYFKTKFNMTPNVFINQERLRQAVQLMQNESGLSIRSICQEVGFKSTSYFIKLFREHYGQTPKQFQKRQKSRTQKVSV